MVFKGSLIYVTLPLALAIGLIWFRRKKIHCDSGGKSTVDQEKNSNKTKTQDVETNDQKADSNNLRSDIKHSNSVPIGGAGGNNLVNNSHNVSPSGSKPKSNDSSDFKFGKSAPIDITPNKATPSRNKSAEKLDEKRDTLNSIEEHSFDSVDLPGSLECRRRFSFGTTIKSNEPAVVVKASTIDVHKSPQSSFGDTNQSSFSSSSSSGGGGNLQNDSQLNNSNNNSNNNNKNSNIKMKQQESIQNATEVNHDAKDVLEVNTEQSSCGQLSNRVAVASPPLSLCSNKSNHSNESNDSGKGSSPPNSEGGHQVMSSSIVSYDFEIPQNYVGYVVGKGGSNIDNLKKKTGAIILIKKHPLKKKLKLCTLKGSQAQIDSALELVKSKLPSRANLRRVEYHIDNSNLIVAEATLDSKLLQVCIKLKIIDKKNKIKIKCCIINL